MRWYVVLLLALLPYIAAAQTEDPLEDRRATLLGILAEPEGTTKEERLRRTNALIELEQLSVFKKWTDLRSKGTFLEPNAKFPYQMTFAEGATEAARLVGMIEGANHTCVIVRSFERPVANTTRVLCGDLLDPLSSGVPYDVVERGDGVSVYSLGDK